MVESRRRFLEAGYYEPFRQALCRLAAECASQLGSPAGEGLFLCDAGCGEGYYTAGLKALPPARSRVRYLQAGGKGRRGKHKGIPFAVASSLPSPWGRGASTC